MNSRPPRLSPPKILLVVAALAAPLDRSASAQTTAAAEPTSSPLPVSPSQPSPDVGDQRGAALSDGDKLLQQSATMLQRRASISARLRHQISFGDKQLYGVGSYWQQGNGADLRVRLELQIAGQDASLLQISNSRFLWTDRRLPTGRGVSRIDLWQLRADPVLAEASPGDLEPGKAVWASLQPDLMPHCGGLPSMLASLAENFSFLPPQAMRLASQPPSDSQSASTPVFAVVGHWKHKELAALLAESEESRESRAESREPEAPENHPRSMLNALPNRLPQEVLLLVGQADLFPHRIEYRRLETPLAANRTAQPIPYQLSASPLVVLELTDVVFDAPIAAGQFDYAPGDADWTDHTAMILERLRRERQQAIARRPGADKNSLPAR